MAKVKIANGLARWREEGKRGEVTKTAFYGNIVDVPVAEAKRLLASGQAVEADATLDRPGELMALPNTASDEELRAWVSAANDDEIEAEKEKRPDIADRIDDAVKYSRDSGSETTAGTTGQPGEPDAGAGQTDAEAAEAAALAEAEAAEREAEYDTIVQGNVDSVSKHLSDNPTDAEAVLAAENRRAAAEGGDPRKGVLEAVHIAAGHTA